MALELFTNAHFEAPPTDPDQLSEEEPGDLKFSQDPGVLPLGESSEPQQEGLIVCFVLY